MILDSSAIVAIVLKEPGYERLVERLAEAPRAGIGAPTLTETGIVLSFRLRTDARGLLARFLQTAGVEVVPSSPCRSPGLEGRDSLTERQERCDPRRTRRHLSRPLPG